ncbi:hypothetical protein MMC16_000146 [Acarospora aff. strigata]|nr:hypothetical protein [Acarospora aff. strigata]
MPPKPKLNVKSFPRPPLLEKTPRHLQIKWNDLLIADTKDAYWILETHHPPTYYLPPTSLHPSLTLPATPHRSFCEYKGLATYHSLTHPSTGTTVSNRIWSYNNPSKEYEVIKGYLSFYAGGVPWECFVDGEKVQAQEGDFYGGWVTAEVEGAVKGARGTEGW